MGSLNNGCIGHALHCGRLWLPLCRPVAGLVCINSNNNHCVNIGFFRGGVWESPAALPCVVLFIVHACSPVGKAVLSYLSSSLCLCTCTCSPETILQRCIVYNTVLQTVSWWIWLWQDASPAAQRRAASGT